MVPVTFVTEENQKFVEKFYNRAIAVQNATYLRERTALSKMSHPNVTRLAGLRGDDRIRLPYIDAVDLQEYLEDGSFSANKTVEITQDVLKGLEHMHSQGIYHRDIKPANILLTTDTAIIIDLGLAYHQSLNHLEVPEQVIGTPRYVSPEMIRSDSIVDHRQDFYSLGLTIFEMLTGKQAVKGRTYQRVINAHLNDVILPPTDFNPKIPTELSDVVLRACAKTPSDRYDSAEEMSQALIKVPDERTVKISVYDCS